MPSTPALMGRANKAPNTSTARCGSYQHALQARQVVPMRPGQLLDARMQPLERTVVRRQHQHIVGDAPLDGGQRVEPVVQRIAVRLGGIHRHIRRNPRQHLISRDEQLEFGTIETGMLGRVAAAHDHPPLVGADPQHIAVLEPPIRGRQGINQFAERAEFGLVSFERFLVPARGTIKGDCVGRGANARYPPPSGGSSSTPAGSSTGVS